MAAYKEVPLASGAGLFTLAGELIYAVFKKHDVPQLKVGVFGNHLKLTVSHDRPTKSCAPLQPSFESFAHQSERERPGEKNAESERALRRRGVFEAPRPSHLGLRRRAIRGVRTFEDRGTTNLAIVS